MRFDYLVYIGRFEPFHDGHLQTLHHALGLASKVVVLIGSAHRPRNIRTPWTAPERAAMVHAAAGDDADRVICVSLRDHLYNDDAWVAAVQSHVVRILEDDGAGEDARIGLVGPARDGDGFDRKAFPQWPLVDVPSTEALLEEDIRRHYFSADPDDLDQVRRNVPAPVWELIDSFRNESEAYPALVDELRFVRDYRKSWESAPYPPTFVTVDAVVVHSGHVLLVRRGAQPGKGQWALPGGFVRQHETLEAAVLRELREETRLKLPAPVLRGSIRAREVFDHPDRSLRGRTITHAFHFSFPTGDLPPVKGGDDAAKARWFLLGAVRKMEEELYEDHFHILERFIGTG